MMAGSDPPSRIESAIRSPSTGANLNPCPEQALITVKPGSSRGEEEPFVGGVGVHAYASLDDVVGHAAKAGAREIADRLQVGLANFTVDGVRIDVISFVVPAELDAAPVGGWKAVSKTAVRCLADEDRKALRGK